ncbi:MAG: DNA translocase FtsK 4TM domain-containing protein [Polyangiales bacterium]
MSAHETTPEEPLDVILGRRHEVLGIVAAAATLLMSLSLLSYDARGGENLIGPVGTALASMLASAFGVAAWLLPIESGLASIRLFTGRSALLGVATVASTLVIVLVGCALTHLALGDTQVFGGHLPGGVIGEVLGEVLRSLLGLTGAFIVGIAVLLITMVLRTPWSVTEIAIKVWTVLRAAALRFAGACRAVVEAWREARELERAEREAAERAAEPRIVGGSVPPGCDVTSDGPADEGGDLEPDSGTFATQDEDEALGQDDEDEEAEAFAAEDEVEDDEAFAEEAEAAEEEEEEEDEPEEAFVAPVVPLRAPKAAKPAQAKPASVPPEPIRAEPPKSSASLRPPKAPSAHEPTIVAPRRDPASERPAKAGEPAAAPRRGFQLPPTSLLEEGDRSEVAIDPAVLKETARRLTETLEAYGVRGRVDEIHPGPVVTMYEFEPASGTKVSKIAGLGDDLALALAAEKVRIVAPIPGKARVGFELPNGRRKTVHMRQILEHEGWSKHTVPLPIALGQDITGRPVYYDLAKMPHLLVAGATGAGKSVGLNVMLASLLYKKTPDDLRMLMIDPKVVELKVFDGIPHMLLPVVTDMKKAALALKWAVDEMERRYQLFADAGAKNIITFNERVEKVHAGSMTLAQFMPSRVKKVRAQGPDGEELFLDPSDDERPDALQDLPKKLPYIVVVVDEFADLMMVAAKDVEACVARLAQKARAAGIHVILATQRPSVDVITGMIKANFPARMAFKVSQREDSRTILGCQGAEHLLGMGDMLLIPPGSSDPRRVHSAFISEDEVQSVCDFLRQQGKPIYDENILKPRDDDAEGDAGGGGGEGGDDPLYDRAVACVVQAGFCSISQIQRVLGVGYNKAAKLVDQMEREGVVGPASSKAGGRREVIAQPI